jgi:hypothetical protein
MADTPTTPTTTSGTLAGLTGERFALAALLTVGLVLLLGAMVIGGRWLIERRSGTDPKDDTDRTWIRSWLAVSLVAGLLTFCAISFWTDDQQLRSTLIGGVVASAGAAVAFYFASRASDQARKDILGAALGSVTIPDLTGMTPVQVNSTLAGLAVKASFTPPEPDDAAKVTDQSPKPGGTTPVDSYVQVTFGPEITPDR